MEINSSSKRRKWTRDELLLAVNLFCRMPFGKINSKNPQVIELARYLDRSAGSIAMKLANFASMDPSLQARNVSGLKNASKLDREVWAEFFSDWESLAFESQKAFLKIQSKEKSDTFLPDSEIEIPTGETEVERLVKTRLVQGFFRNTVLASYEYRCTFCNFNMPEFLVAGHIIPWSENKQKRAVPTNGLCLCSLHDKAFDRGFMSVDDNYRILLSDPIRKLKTESPIHKAGFINIEGKSITLPHRFLPEKEALQYHRENVYQEKGSIG